MALRVMFSSLILLHLIDSCTADCAFSPGAALVAASRPPPCSYYRTVRPPAAPSEQAWLCRGRLPPGPPSSASRGTHEPSWHCDRWHSPGHTQGQTTTARHTKQKQSARSVQDLIETYHHNHTTTILRPFFWDHPCEPVPEESFFWTLWCKGG